MVLGPATLALAFFGGSEGLVPARALVRPLPCAAAASGGAVFDVAVAQGLERFAAALTGIATGLALEPTLLAMLDVPSAPLKRRMPRSSKGANAVEVYKLARRAAALNTLVVVFRHMVRMRDASQIAEVIIQRISVDVMDVVPLRDGAVGAFPEIPVQVDRRRIVTAMRLKIDPMLAVRRIRVTAETNTVHFDGFDVWHGANSTSSWSYHFIASMRTNPRFAV